MKIYPYLALSLAISGSMILSGCTTSPSQQQLQKHSQPKLEDKMLVQGQLLSDIKLSPEKTMIHGEFKHEVRQFQKPYDNQQAEQISLMV